MLSGYTALLFRPDGKKPFSRGPPFGAGAHLQPAMDFSCFVLSGELFHRGVFQRGAGHRRLGRLGGLSDRWTRSRLE